MCSPRGVEHWMGSGAPKAYQPQPNSEYPGAQRGRQTVGAKVHCREGNSPDRQLRSPNRG